MTDIRDTYLGGLLRAVGLRRGLRYPEEIAGFKPQVAAPLLSGSSGSEKDVYYQARLPRRPPPTRVFPTVTSGYHNVNNAVLLVDWYDAGDVANPRNWSPAKKAWVTAIIFYYTFVVCVSASILFPSNERLIVRFGISQELASLGLSMYVAGYGVGPMYFSPLSEIAYIGRNPPYIISFVFFLLFSVLAAAVADKSFAALIVLRFLQGFCGSPILASGGASLEDIYDWSSIPYAYIVWVIAFYCGPALGPMLSAYAVPHDFRWPLWEIIIMSVPLLPILLAALPETSGRKILYQRAARLRATTQDSRHKSQAEVIQLPPLALLVDALIKPLEISIKDPAMGFVGVYIALLYATYYSFFEAFPIVYAGTYAMSLGSMALIFLSVVVGCILLAIVYVLYLYFYFVPEVRRLQAQGTPAPQEFCLRPALLAVLFLPASLLLFAWSARSDVHWIWPTIGIVMYTGSAYVIYQCLICYIPQTYPKYVASLFASGDFFRSSLAVGFIMFSRPMYLNLGIAKGVTTLAGLSLMGILGMYYLYFYGAKMRARSSFAESKSDWNYQDEGRVDATI